MAIQTTSLQSTAVGTRYALRYQRGADARRFYDQWAGHILANSQYNLENRKGMGTTYTLAFASRMSTGVTAISEQNDVVPQIIRDASTTFSTTSRGEIMQWAELLTLESYMDEVAQRAEIIGINAVESIEALAITAALGGSLVSRGAARASLDAGTAGHLFTEAAIWKAGSVLADIQAPMYVDGKSGSSSWMAGIHTDGNYDLSHSGNLVNAALYQDKEMLLNGEVGRVSNFRILASPFAKIFMGAGIDNASAVATTLNDTSALALDTTVVVTSGTNISVGRHLAIGTEETGSTFYPMNELVSYVSGTTTVTFVGAGSNGGFRYDHANGEAVNNNDNVYPVLYGSPDSLVKAYASDVGEFGQMVGPRPVGSLDQWTEQGWKWYGGYGRVAENRLIRGEYASSLDA